jgi:hypothetical protein
MPKLPINYENACIYEIVCKDVNITERYVGSTTNLIQRRRDHKKVCNNENGKQYNRYVYQFIRANSEWENWDVVLIEQVIDCKDKEHLHKIERFYIESLKAELNKNIPLRTHKEYREENKEDIQKKKKIYCENNKEEIAKRKKEYREENKEDIQKKKKIYRENNKEEIAKRKKEYRENNKEEIAKRMKEYRENNKEKIAERKKEYRENNKEKIAERKKEYRENKTRI